MSRHEVRISLNPEQEALAAQIGQQMGTSGFGVVVLLLGGEMAALEGRLDADGLRMLSELRAMLGADE